MKNWKPLLIVVLIVAALFAIGYLHEKGYLNFKWQWLTIIAAALAAPYKLFMKWLKGSGGTIEEITKQHEALRKQEEEYRSGVESRINEKEQRIAGMQKDIELLDVKLELLKAKRENVQKEIQSMSIEDKIRAGQQEFGR